LPDLCLAVLVVSYPFVVEIKFFLQLFVKYLEVKDNLEDIVYILLDVSETWSAKDYFQNLTLKLYMFFQDFIKTFAGIDLFRKFIPTLLYCDH
jgi:hypothetical protein